MKLKLLLIAITIGLFVGSAGVYGQVNYVSWNFNTNITNANYSTNTTNQNGARSSALTTPTLSTISINGTGISGANAFTLHRSTGWPTTLEITKHLEFSITLAAGQTFNNTTLNLLVAAGVSNIGTAPRNYLVQYGWGPSPTFAAVTGANNANATPTTGGTVTLLTAAQTSNNATIPAPGNTTSTILTIRLIAYGSTSSSGNLQVGSIALTAASLPSTSDTTPPTVTTLSPADNATGVAINSNLVLTFDENVVVGTAGDIVIYNSDTTVFETIPYNDSRIVFNGTTGVTINPLGIFVNNAGYYVQIANTAIRDVALNAYAGISNNTTWNFTAEAPTTIIWTNPITGTNPDTANPYTTGQSFNGNITVSGIGRGSGIGANNATDRYNANDWNSGTLNTNDYFEFTLTPNAGYEINFINFVYTSERNNTSIANFAFRSSVSTYTANIGTPTFNGTTISLSGAAYQNRTTATTFRIYAWGADTSTRTFSINDFIFNGTVIQTTLATDYFRSRASGTWATASNWESSRDNTNWITSTLAPTSAANTITIRDLHTITISGAVTADQITVESGGTLVLNGADLTLNNGTGTDLTIASGGTFDNGGENLITRTGIPSISIGGTFITRDAQGFVGFNTAIPDISTTLNAGSIVVYGLNGDQDVQGLTAPTYSNVTFSGTGTKTLLSTNAVTGTVTIKDAAIFNSTSFTFGGAETNLTMTDISHLIVSGARPVPDMRGTYTLTGGTIEFAGNSNSHTARSPITYNNVVISGSNVNGSAGNYTLRNGATFTVNAGGVFTVSDQRIIAGGASATININGSFVTKDADGFYGPGLTSISPTNTILNLGSASTIEYAGADQSIATVPVTTAYANITISGTEIKTIPTQLFLGNNLSVYASTLLIESGKALTVTNNVVVSLGATMTINDKGSLVQVNNYAVNTGNITYERNTTAEEFDYTYFSSPVAGQTLLAVSPSTKLDKFFSFNAAANDWLQEDISAIMTIGKGYIIRGIPPPPSPAIPPGFYTAPFFGKPNNGIINVPILWDGTSIDGTSNLIGNPYPSAIDADNFLHLNSSVIEGTIYFWTHNTSMQNRDLIVGNNPDGTPKAGSGALAYTTDDYASYNLLGGVGTMAPSGSNGGVNNNKPIGKIATGQAFFTTSLKINATSTATFNNSMRLDKDSKIMDNSQFFKTRNPNPKTITLEKHRIWLNLTNTQGVFKQTLVGYITDATNEYDSRFDGESFDGNEFVDFYSLSQDKNLVIQGRALPFDENDQVPLGFRTTINGTFTIKIDQADGVLTNQAVFIEDKLTNSTSDLRSGPFTFNTAAGTFNDRFVLRYANKTLGNNDLETFENQVLVSNKNKQIKVNSKVEPINKVVVYDLLGRLLFKKDKVNNTEFSILNLISNSETLLVKVTLQNGETVTRKILY
ncbi:T9SS sorting signal type C domain-containing protein [Flavobacterium franklandianum]|uniref:Ig-like domain-containing protein n=1 Tax=Flavobacterium franklandianum TaxID=2594430 RepID=UPI001179DD6A|nr:Ig-like domain-containing protein [Flavobacterium franklandianum]TRX29108.1 T9SS sorting signal type C domain-containing protein [Flavobacterium franklandianum]